MTSISLPCHVKNLIGQRFGKLVVLKFAGIQRTRATWLCKCDCGNSRVISANTMKRGNTRSCGCLALGHGEDVHGHAKRAWPHGESPEYATWHRMKRRCYNENEHNFRHYGGRGIVVCDRWRFSFQNFLDDMGLRPSPNHSIDRIDVDGNYEPANCRWATPVEQARNKRSNKRLAGTK